MLHLEIAVVVDKPFVIACLQLCSESDRHAGNGFINARNALGHIAKAVTQPLIYLYIYPLSINAFVVHGNLYSKPVFTVECMKCERAFFFNVVPKIPHYLIARRHGYPEA